MLGIVSLYIFVENNAVSSRVRQSPENIAFSGLSLFSAIVLLLYTQFIELFALVYIFIDKFCRLEPFTAFLLQFTLYISIAVTAI